MPPGLIGFKVLVIMHELTENFVISVAQTVMGSKLLIKMTRLQNIKIKGQCFVTWSKILISSTSGGLEPLK